MHILDLNLKNVGEKFDGSIMESKGGIQHPKNKNKIGY